MNVAPPADQEIVRCLEETLCLEHSQPRVTGMERGPFLSATSHPLEEVTAHLDDGRVLRLILKDLTWQRRPAAVRLIKPRFLYEPRRCIESYRRILAANGLGAACYGAFTDDQAHRYWLLIERVPGVELWQIDDVGTWEGVARWLARFHRTFADEGEHVVRRNPYLLDYGPEFLRLWPVRAINAASKQGVEHARLERMASLVARYDQVVDRLAGVPRAFVHGEFYPSNVLVGVNRERGAVWPVDWEMAGVGPPLLDLAALTAGWGGTEQAKLADAYADEFAMNGWLGDREEMLTLLDCCRLHYALQWLGWSIEWSPPPEHALDWVSEAVRLGDRLGL